MGINIIAKQTVGKTEYQLVDNDLLYSHNAKKGTIAISNVSGKIYINVDGAYDWDEMNINIKSEVYSFDNSDSLSGSSFNTSTLYLNSALGLTNWSGTNNNFFTVDQKGRMNIDENITSRFLTINSHEFLTPTANAWIFETICAKNAFAFQPYIEGDIKAAASASTNTVSTKIFNVDGNVRDFVCGAFGIPSIPSASFCPRNITSTAILLQTPTTIMFEDFESGSFNKNNWNTAQSGQTNQWYVGSSTSSGGTYSAYISNNSGSTATYTKTSASVSHVYKDFILPPASAMSMVHLSFRWKCYGEIIGSTLYDYGKVYLLPTTVTPVAGSLLSSSYRIGDIGYTGTTTWKFSSIEILPENTYESSRLVFSFRNDTSSGTDPGFCIDNVKIYYY